MASCAASKRCPASNKQMTGRVAGRPLQIHIATSGGLTQLLGLLMLLMYYDELSRNTCSGLMLPRKCENCHRLCWRQGQRRSISTTG